MATVSITLASSTFSDKLFPNKKILCFCILENNKLLVSLFILATMKAFLHLVWLCIIFLTSLLASCNFSMNWTLSILSGSSTNAVIGEPGAANAAFANCCPLILYALTILNGLKILTTTQKHASSPTHYERIWSWNESRSEDIVPACVLLFLYFRRSDLWRISKAILHL